jgi:1-aminocyclopropane-1-carboxylate deaminase/D-cysteine desulfhydrase-like pyridoxal-dependent ACC family enzyme
VIQQGQVFMLKAKGADGQPLWAYRYRLEGRSSARPQVGGFATRAEAQKGLRKALDRVCPGRGGATTLAELVEEYLQLHQAEPVTIAKLRSGRRPQPWVRWPCRRSRRKTSTPGG